jgi:leucyl/phenylalanyl-tRNA---protein transferase
MPFLLPERTDTPFPPAHAAPAHGLLAVGGDLSPPRLRNAYRHGIFPWFGEDDPLLWWSPDPRWVLRSDDFHLSRSLRRFLRRCPWTLSIDRDFAAVIDGCARPRSDGDGTWITAGMRSAYLALAGAGIAHSLEVWEGDALVGGIYGVGVGRVFCAESMFSTVSNASKVALLGLVRNFAALGGVLIDCQLHNPHIETLGVRPWPRRDYLALLAEVRDDPDPLAAGALPFSRVIELV